ncbi:MAG: hypothetical protein ACK4N5_20825, partial [Myxococcales bacterium]
GKVVRVRESGAAWAVDRGPFDVPTKLRSAPSAAVDGAGTLYLGYGIDSTKTVFGFPDNMESPRVVKLGPTDTAFGTEEAPGGAVDDRIIHTRLDVAADGRVLMTYCSDDSSLVFLNTRMCFKRMRAAAGGWTTPPAPAKARCLEYAFSATTLSA